MIIWILSFYAIVGGIYWGASLIKTIPAVLGFIIRGAFVIAILPFFPILNTYGQFKKGKKALGWTLAVLSVFIYTTFIGVWILDPPL